MPISSLILKTADSASTAVAERVDRIDGAEVTDRLDDRLVVLTTTDDRKADQSLWEQLEALEGVVSLNLIYHNFEDMEEKVS